MASTPASLLPEDEAERLHSLQYYDILHSLQEPIFDAFVTLTARIFNLPISLIALVDADEVEYKANVGLPGQTKQPRVEALCSLAVQQNTAVVLADLTQAERLTAEAAAAARARDLHFYAGAPLRMPDQRSIGTLCVIDRVPRSFSAQEQQILEKVAELVAQTIAIRAACLHQQGKGIRYWQQVEERVVEEVQGLAALVRYLLTRYGTFIPVPDTVLTPVSRRLHDMQEILGEMS